MTNEQFAQDVLESLIAELDRYMAQYEHPRRADGSKYVVFGLQLAEKLLAKRHGELSQYKEVKR